jgi:hypothetical protein
MYSFCSKFGTFDIRPCPEALIFFFINVNDPNVLNEDWLICGVENLILKATAVNLFLSFFRDSNKQLPEVLLHSDIISYTDAIGVHPQDQGMKSTHHGTFLVNALTRNPP